ncbi:unnamed protein product [Trichogramma brassicae]|uniref:Uncharacterized protein n=1 Tax=Trichogramma brassicae TaxID=86971 RepID=A0A6H5IQ60_9HYME|nr:unnamed protein product [Trichogramma brassicae]
MHAVQHSREAGNFELLRTTPALQSKVYTYNIGYVSGGTHTADRLISRGNKTRAGYTRGIRRIHQPRRIHGRYTCIHRNTDMHTSKSEQRKEGERVRRKTVHMATGARAFCVSKLFQFCGTTQEYTHVSFCPTRLRAKRTRIRQFQYSQGYKIKLNKHISILFIWKFTRCIDTLESVYSEPRRRARASRCKSFVMAFSGCILCAAAAAAAPERTNMDLIRNNTTFESLQDRDQAGDESYLNSDTSSDDSEPSLDTSSNRSYSSSSSSSDDSESSWSSSSDDSSDSSSDDEYHKIRKLKIFAREIHSRHRKRATGIFDRAALSLDQRLDEPISKSSPDLSSRRNRASSIGRRELRGPSMG